LFCAYSGLTLALSAYPAFTTTGSDTVKKREAAAFLANVSHETGGLVSIVEKDTANNPHYCDTSQPYGCPAGTAAYYGRGPLQLSWNFNYKGFGETIRSINGDLECNGKNASERDDRINLYKKFVGVLGTSAGDNLSC
jgi:chitinase